MIDIPLNAKVECVDGSYGESTCVIINPITKKVTHFVVQGTGLHSSKEHLVSIDQVVETTSATIRLACTKDELAVQRGARVEATDGNVGKVAEFFSGSGQRPHHPHGSDGRSPVG